MILEIEIYSTGGTQKFYRRSRVVTVKQSRRFNYLSLNIRRKRVKTLHPNVFGGILSRREFDSDNEQLKKYNIPEFDLVIVDLYPFEKTVSSGASEQNIIEKIDIGGISLIKAAFLRKRNYKDVFIVSEMSQYERSYYQF